MEQIKEAVYLINDERYLHLRENGAGVGFATYNKVTGEPLESGQISEKNLPPDGQNTIPAARNWYLFELSDDDRKAIQQESVKILENIPQAGIGRRRIWEPETLPKDIRLINSHYDDLYRIPDGGVIQVDYPDGRSFTARVEHLDDYHFDMGGLGNVFHICQFAEVMERNHADFYPEIQTQDEQAAWELGGKGYLAIQSCDDGWLPKSFGKKNKSGARPYILTFMYVVGIIPIVFGLSITTITNMVQLITSAFAILNFTAEIKMPKKYPDAWKQSRYHVPDGLYYTICCVSLALFLVVLWKSLLSMNIGLAVINVVVIVIAGLIGFWRSKTGNIEIHTSVWAEDYQEAANS